MTKLKVRTILRNDITNDLEDLSIEQTINFLSSWLRTEYDEVKVELYRDWEYTNIQIVGYRLENDEEYNKRCGKESTEKKRKIKKVKEKMAKLRKELRSLE